MPVAKYSSAEVAAIGEDLYAREIQSRVESQNKGKYLVLDVETGHYEIDIDDLAATKRAVSKRPGAILYGLRIGYPTAYRLGGVSRLESR